MDAGYYTTRSRSTRAASAHHTEAGAKRELPWTIYEETGGAYAFAKGDRVIVIDRTHDYYNMEGVIHEPITRSKYLVRFPWNTTAIHPFRKTQLRKIEKKGADKPLLFLAEYSSCVVWDKRDLFQIEWGVFRLVDHPNIPRRYAAWKARQAAKVTAHQAIELPAHAQSTIDDARAAFAAKVAALDICPVETARMNAILERARNYQDRPRTQKNRHTRDFAPDKAVVRHKRAMPPKLRVRKVAA